MRAAGQRQVPPLVSSACDSATRNAAAAVVNTCVMAVRQRQRDMLPGIAARRLSWPVVMLADGIGMNLTADSGQAQPGCLGPAGSCPSRA